jgi:hypothetical protein
MKWTGHEARLGEVRNTHRLLLGRPEENTPLGRLRCRRKNNMKQDIKEVGWEGVD